MSKKAFYITTTLPYVNAEPHIGFAMEIIQADIIARWRKLQGDEVFFNTGTDEHGQKVYKAALAAGQDPQKYCDEYAEIFKKLIPLLGLSQDIHFIRTTDHKHKDAAQEMWRRCKDAGYIEKKLYQIKYCTGCELEKSDSELVNGRCSLHPDRELEIREEENYFFKFSAFADKLRELYKNAEFVIPDFRLNEMRALLERGLEDFSISRLKEKMSWGVPVPDDDKHVMYVWFDALTNYISTLGWPDNKENFEKFWTGKNNVQFAGKDQVRQQAAMWQAMLLAAGLPPTSQIIIHGFLNLSGQKMSKSLGNVLSPTEMVKRYDAEATRALLAGVNQFEDTDVNMGVGGEGFDLAYTTNLANGLGNLVARIMTLATSLLAEDPGARNVEILDSVKSNLESFKVQDALSAIWTEIHLLDKDIQEKKPWETKDREVIKGFVTKLAIIAKSLEPFMPETSSKILDAIAKNTKPENLFPRLV